MDLLSYISLNKSQAGYLIDFAGYVWYTLRVKTFLVPVVQWIERKPSKLLTRVRFLPGTQNKLITNNL